MTGFRLAPGGAQERLGIRADLLTYGKVIGGGMPVGAFGGRQEIMEKIAPLGNVYQAGTLSGNPIAMIAGYTMLKALKDNPAIYGTGGKDHLFAGRAGAGICGLGAAVYRINQLGSMISVHFSDHDVTGFCIGSRAPK
jgi:glutamate-1-semialdehyde 2,1-aminomutase